MKKHRSPIWKINKETLVDVISKRNTFSDVLQFFDLANKGGNYKTLRDRCEFDNIDLTQLRKRSEEIRVRGFKNKEKLPLDKVLVKNSTYNRGSLKKRLVEEKILKYECSICEQSSVWKEKPLVLVLDHINGISNDHRIKNLRFLCPNCNSQTSTFAGRNVIYKKKIIFCECGKKISLQSKRCKECSAKANGLKRRKVKRPSIEELQKMMETMSICAIARKYGVSDNAIRKWVR
jgi:hypothetical protein